jgi:LuxR family transcriptional regulator, maltose regulon positive regulatory protein
MIEENNPLLQTKLHRPRLASDLVIRPRLLEMLNRGLEGRLTLVCAPAGFGKTTLVSSWIESISQSGNGVTSPYPAAWLSLDEYDSDLNLFLRYFIAALRTIFKDACPETDELLQARQQPPLTVLSKTLSNEIERLPEHFILVLDDYHLLQGDAVHNLLNQWVRHWPRPLHLVLIARKDPPLSLASLRARGKLSEIRSRDLRFTDNETVTFLDRVLEKSLRNPVIALLKERTEGWIAGLKLATLWLRAAGNTDQVLDSLPITDSGVADYLMDEVLSHQLPAIQMFLLKTSILNRFCAPLCEAVIGESDPAWNISASIDWLERLNLFVTSLDSRKEWYRYHRLFQEFLQNRLSAGLGSGQVKELHVRAASWFADQGLVEEALHYALEAKDHDLAARLMEQGLRDVLNREDRPTLERWSRLLPEEVVQKHPGLMMIKAWALQFLFQLDAQARVLRQVEELLDADGSASLLTDDLQILRGQITGLRMQEAYFNNQPTLAITLCHETLALLPRSWIYIRGGVMQYMGMCMQTNGQAAEAERQLLEEYEAHPDKADIYALRILVGLCYNHLKTGQLEQTRQIARLLLQGANESRLPVLQSWGEYFLGIVHYHWNEVDFAARHFTRILDNRYTAQITVFRDAVAGLAVIHQAKGESSEAWQMVELISQFDLEQRGIENDRTRSLRACLLLSQGDMDAAGRWAGAFTDLPPDQPFMWLEEPQVTRAQVLVARGGDDDLRLALQILDALDEIADRTHNTCHKIEVLALRALALDAQGNSADADRALCQSIDLSQPGGFIRVYLDLGAPMQAMLSRLAGYGTVVGQSSAAGAQGSAAPTIHRILAAFAGSRGGTGFRDDQFRTKAPDSEFVEPLTGREHEILALMGEPLSPKEIAFRLGISRSTVKRHSATIYRKLGVNSRWEAVAKAKTLSVLPIR